MTFANYQNSNNASSKLLADISASTTIILITSWEEALFPNSYPFLLTIEKLNSDWNVVLREIVKVVSWNQNSFVVERWAWKCVQDDTATTRVQASATHSFSAWDRISLYWTAEQVKDIQDDLSSKLSIEEYQSWNYVYWASTTWNDDYSITLPFPPTAYAIWQVFRFLAWTENTWPATLNVNWLWAISIMKNHDVQLDTWDIEAWQIVEVAYDWTNFQMNSQTATIVDMKDIKTLSFSWLKAWEDLQEWNAVQIANKGFSETLATESLSLWWVSSLKWGIWFEANWDTIQDLQIKASVIEWTTPTAITVNLESDNNGSPSWTVLSTADVLTSFSWNINTASVSETNMWALYWSFADNTQYFWWGNLWKTRCFYVKNASWYLAADWVMQLIRWMTNSDSSWATLTTYDIPASAFINAIWLTSATHTYSIWYVDQDFQFMFVREDSTDKVYKLWFNASWNRITSFNVLWSRTKSSLWIVSGAWSLQIAFSDDWMFAYIPTSTNDYNSSSIKSYSLQAPYDFTWMTEIWTTRDIWTYMFWANYMSLKWWKKYVVAWYQNNRYIVAREINSDWTMWSTNISLKSWSSWSWFAHSFAIWNYANWWAAIYIPYTYSSNTRRTYRYELGLAYFSDPVVVDIRLWSLIPTTSWNKYWITIYPTWDSVQNYVNLYSYWWNEHTSLSKYTDSWSSVSNMSPYLSWDWIKGIYIRKQIDSQIPFWNYGIADNNYEAFSQARFVNMWISNHNSWLIASARYFMQDWKLNLNSWQYIWTATNETTLNIWKLEDDSSKLSNIVSQALPNATVYWAETTIMTAIARVSWYYSLIVSSMNAYDSHEWKIKVVIWWDTTEISTVWWANFRWNYYRSWYVNKWKAIEIKVVPYDSTHWIYLWWWALYWPDWSV